MAIPILDWQTVALISMDELRFCSFCLWIFFCYRNLQHLWQLLGLTAYNGFHINSKFQLRMFVRTQPSIDKKRRCTPLRLAEKIFMECLLFNLQRMRRGFLEGVFQWGSGGFIWFVLNLAIAGAFSALRRLVSVVNCWSSECCHVESCIVCFDWWFNDWNLISSEAINQVTAYLA